MVVRRGCSPKASILCKSQKYKLQKINKQNKNQLMITMIKGKCGACSLELKSTHCQLDPLLFRNFVVDLDGYWYLGRQ